MILLVLTRLIRLVFARFVLHISLPLLLSFPSSLRVVLEKRLAFCLKLFCLLPVRSPPTEPFRLLHAPVQSFCVGSCARCCCRARPMCSFVFVPEPAPMSPAFAPIFLCHALLVALRLRKPLFKVSVLALCVFPLFRCIRHGVALLVSSASFLFANVVLLLPPPDRLASPLSTHHARLLHPISLSKVMGSGARYGEVEQRVSETQVLETPRARAERGFASRSTRSAMKRSSFSGKGRRWNWSEVGGGVFCVSRPHISEFSLRAHHFLQRVVCTSNVCLSAWSGSS